MQLSLAFLIPKFEDNTNLGRNSCTDFEHITAELFHQLSIHWSAYGALIVNNINFN